MGEMTMPAQSISDTSTQQPDGATPGVFSRFRPPVLPFSEWWKTPLFPSAAPQKAPDTPPQDAPREMVPPVYAGEVFDTPDFSTAVAVRARESISTVRLLREIGEWLAVVAAVLIFALVVRAYVAEPIRVEGRSMLDTLHESEFVLVTKFDYVETAPVRFDVVSCRFPDSGRAFVKRVIGLPGESVALRGGALFIDDVEVAQPFLTRADASDFGPVLIPAGHYFVLGDNRVISQDSRDSSVGMLPRASILGRVRSVVLPVADMRPIVRVPSR